MTKAAPKTSSTLNELLGSVPDKHHAKTKLGGHLSVNGRHPAPLERWQPAYCGDIDMAIAADGTWYHEGTAIRRPELWQLFAGILRREADNEYYLITPVEKCRVSVALHPLIITDIMADETAEEPTLVALLNAGGMFPIGDAFPIQPEPRASGAAFISLPHGLSAICSRAAWYRLVKLADERHRVFSSGVCFNLLPE